MFGFLSYDLKNEIENLNSENKDNFHVPNIFFFIPQTILFVSNNELKVETFLSKNEIDKMIDDIKNEIDFDEKDNECRITIYRRERKLPSKNT